MANETIGQKLGLSGADHDAIVAQITSLREDVAKLAHTVSASVSRQGHAFSKDVSDGMAEAANYVRHRGHDADVRVEAAVAANPYVALGLAAGMGILLGALTRR
jgi:ElaB/YqjD/DUF883 family membrane-anchored ribosome-binding protein